MHIQNHFFNLDAKQSSEIEGTRTTLGEVYRADEAKVQPENRSTEEVLNYKKAMRWLVEKITSEPIITHELIKNAQKILLTNVQGFTANLGNYKEKPNWVGPFTPPLPEETLALMDDLIQYMNQ